jgi:penicillin-binding protein 2
MRVTFGLIVVVGFFLLGGLVKLQVVDHAELAERSENNRIRVHPIIPRRGVVFDRDNRVIIDNRPSYTVSVVPAEEVSGITLANLAELISLDTTQIRKRIRRTMVSRYQPAPVKKDIPFDAIAVLEEQSTRFPGVTYQMERVRLYKDSIGSETITGYVGEISPEDLQNLEMADYQPGNMIGKKGFEKEYDEVLRGREGTKYVEVSASGQILGTYQEREKVEALPGSDVTLTIDLDIQRACVQELDSFCCGAVVAIDPRSGELLAATSYPGLDANIFSSVIPDTLWQQLQTDSTHPMLNRVLNGQYPPGSTTKLVTVGAALEEGLINENTTLKPCYGGMQYGNRFFRCWDHGGHGSLTAVHSLEQSCDVFMYQLGTRLGIDGLARYYDLCGFGKATGIDLPGESKGLNPTSKMYDQMYGKHKWTQALVLNNAIGQGELLATPLQLAQFYCGVVNHGVVYRPHVVKRITAPDGRTVEITSQVSFRLPFTQRTLDLLIEGMRLVVNGEHGTARAQRSKDYTIGGKTGTAQNPHGENHSLFCAAAPLENPEIVVCAIIENAGDGSRVAAPVVARIIKTFMKKRAERLNLVSTDPAESPDAEL